MRQARFLLAITLTAGMPLSAMAAGAEEAAATTPALKVSLSIQEDAVYPTQCLDLRPPSPCGRRTG